MSESSSAWRRSSRLRESSGDISRKLSEYQSQAAEINAEKEKNAVKAEELRNKLSGLERLYKSRREGFEQAKNDFERALYELKDKQQRRKILTDLENNMEGFAGSVKQVLKASKQGRIGGVMGTVAQNIGVEPKYAVAVETALGGAMQNIIVENEDIAKRCIRFLKEQKGMLVAPSKAVNACGVSVSELEMAQNSARLYWEAEEVDEKMHKIMTNIYKSSAAAAERYGLGYDLVAGANIAGFKKVATAMMEQGVF